MERYTLYDFQEYTRRVVALNFPESFWVSCEISQISESRGNYYLNIIEKDESTGQLVAQASAAIWRRSYFFIKNKLGELTPTVLEAGRQVLLKVKVDYSEVYGMKLIIEDVDPTYTIGAMEMERQKTLALLKKKGLVGVNAALATPQVVETIAVISSEHAAGYKDFAKQLDHNNYGYRISHELFSVAVQGRNMESEIVAAISEVAERSHEFDVVVIIRGGGSKLDLSGFDSYNICYVVAKCPIPVLTGIGHEIDDTLVDVVAHTSFKTPTAVAVGLLEISARFEAEIDTAYLTIANLSRQVLRREEFDFRNVTNALHYLVTSQLEKAQEAPHTLYQRIREMISSKVENGNNELSYISRFLETQDPKHILEKGYVYLQRGSSIILPNEVAVGDELSIRAQDVVLSASVTAIEDKTKQQ